MADPAVEKNYWSVDDAASYSGLSKWFWRRKVYSGAVESVKAGTRLLIPVSEIHRVLSNGKRPRLKCADLADEPEGMRTEQDKSRLEHKNKMRVGVCEHGDGPELIANATQVVRSRKQTLEGGTHVIGKHNCEDKSLSGQLRRLNEVATQLNISIRTVRQLMKRGMIPYIKIGGLIMFRQSDVSRFISDNSYPGEPTK